MADAAKPQTEYKRPGFFRRWLTRFFVVIGLMTTLMFALTFAAVTKMAETAPTMMPGKILLTYTFKKGLSEAMPQPSLSQPQSFLKPTERLRDVIVGLHKAEKDARVKGFVAHLQDASFSIAQVQELRDAVAEFRQSGKFAYIYGDDFGGFSPGMSDYYLACAFEQIWLQPLGVVGINGVAAEVPFVRGILDKVGIMPQFSHKGIYKSASETITEKDMSAPNREATEDLVNDLFDQFVKGISADRKIPEDQLLKLVEGAPYNEKDALSLKLVDKVDDYDALIDLAKKNAGLTTQKPMDLLDYAPPDMGSGDKLPEFLKQILAKNAAKSGKAPAKKIALIYGGGEIVPYKNSHGTFGGEGMAAESIVDAFKDADKDADVAAVVFRVDSPGGSPQAAETIRRAILATRKKGRPVVISMGGAAASGGYWLATGADKIVAQPATITGSIGVFGGKMVIQPLWEKLDVKWVGIKKGGNADMWSANTPFSEAEYAKFDALLNDTYEAFLQRVMDARKMSHDQAEAIAEGRVWTGREGKARGLVDELGGLDTAIAVAKKEAKLDEKQEYKVAEFPEPQTPLEEILSSVFTEGEGAFGIPDISAESLLKRLEEQGRTSVRGAALAPMIRVR